jgi:hypothetical protein
LAISSGSEPDRGPARQRRIGQIDQVLDWSAAIVLLGMLIWAIVGFSLHLDCKPEPVTGWESFALVSACAAGFVGGRAVSHLLESQPATRPYASGWMDAGGARILVQAGLVVFLVAATGLLVYETYGLDPPNNAWPITSYVRCATHLNGVMGLILCGFGGTFFCFVIGHWLWYPGKGRSA